MNIVSFFFGNLGKFWQNSSNSRLLRLTFLLLIIQVGLILWFFNQLPPELPLFYSQNWGQSWLASTSSIFILPFFSLIVMIINYSLAIYFYNKKILLSKLLVVFSFILSFLCSIAVMEIISLVS